MGKEGEGGGDEGGIKGEEGRGGKVRGSEKEIEFFFPQVPSSIHSW